MSAVFARSIAFLVCLLLLSCNENGGGGGAALIGGFSSGMTLDAVQQKAEQSGVSLTQLNDYDPGSGHTYERWQAVPFADRGATGYAELDFFDSRLISVAYFPADDRTYLDRLSADLRIPLDREVRSPDDRRVRIRTGVDYKGRRYAVWEDRNLRSALDEWMD